MNNTEWQDDDSNEAENKKLADCIGMAFAITLGLAFVWFVTR